MRKKTQVLNKTVIYGEPENGSLGYVNLVAKLMNDAEFRPLAEEKVTPELISNFVAKQAFNNYLVMKEIEVSQSTQKEKEEQLLAMKYKLNDLKCQGGSETVDSTPRGLHSKISAEPAPIKLEKLRQRLTERKQLIATTLSFITRISHQLSSSNYGGANAIGKQDVNESNLLDVLSQLGMSLDHIIIKSKMWNPRKMNEAEDVGIFVNTAHEDRERADDRRDKEDARGSAYMNDNKNQADKEWTANLKHDLAEKRHIEEAGEGEGRGCRGQDQENKEIQV